MPAPFEFLAGPKTLPQYKLSFGDPAGPVGTLGITLKSLLAIIVHLLLP